MKMKKLILYLILLFVGINTKAQVTANFSMIDSIDCQRMIQFTDMSTGGGSGGVLNWEFGDGFTMITTSNQIVWHYYSTVGIYAVKLKVTDGVGVFSDSIVKNIDIREFPLSFFSYFPSNPTTNDTIQFTNLSTNANSYLWYFYSYNPNDTCKLVNPKHLYDTVGTYYAFLIAFNDSLPYPFCNDTTAKQIIVINPISVEEFSNENVSEPYPNPTSNEFRVNYSITNIDDESTLNVFNNQGKNVKAIKLNPLVNTVTISVKELPPGIYYYEVNSKNSNHTNFRKLIISR